MPTKEARSEVAKERIVPESYMRKEMIKRFRQMIEKRDNTNETLQEDNRKLDDLVTHSDQVITHLEVKVESQRQNEAINRFATEVKKAEHNKMAKQYTQEIKS